MSRKQLLAHCKQASEVVSSWPKWKRNILDGGRGEAKRSGIVFAEDFKQERDRP